MFLSFFQQVDGTNVVPFLLQGCDKTFGELSCIMFTPLVKYRDRFHYFWLQRNHHPVAEHRMERHSFRP